MPVTRKAKVSARQAQQERKAAREAIQVALRTAAKAGKKGGKRSARDTALVALGRWSSTTLGITPFQQFYCAARFVAHCIDPDGDILDFLIPTELVEGRTKATKKLTGKLLGLSIDDNVKIIEELGKHANDTAFNPHQKPIEKFCHDAFNILRQHTMHIQKIYQHMTLLSDVRPNLRAAVDEAIHARFDRPAIKHQKTLKALFDMYSPPRIQEYYEDGGFRDDGLQNKVYDLRPRTNRTEAGKPDGETPPQLPAANTTKSQQSSRAQRRKATTPSLDSERPGKNGSAPKNSAATRTTRATAQATVEPADEPEEDANPVDEYDFGLPEDAFDADAGWDSDFAMFDESDDAPDPDEMDDPTDDPFELPIHDWTARKAEVVYHQKLATRKRKDAPLPKPPRPPPPAQPKRPRLGCSAADFINTAARDEGIGSGASSPNPNRKPFDRSWLFLEPTGQYMSFELPKEGCHGTAGDSVFKAPTGNKKQGAEDTTSADTTSASTESATPIQHPDAAPAEAGARADRPAESDGKAEEATADPPTELHDQDILAEIHSIEATAIHIYMFNKSAGIYHEEQDKLTDRQLMEICFEQGIGYTRHPRTRASVHSNFFKVAPYGTPELEEHLKDFDLDVPLLFRSMFELQDKGDESVVPKGEDKRNTFHFDGGHGVQPYNHTAQPEDTDITASFPMFVNEPREDKPPQYRVLYELVGPVLDVCQDFTDKWGCENGQQPMGDPFRTEKAGAVLREKCGAKRSRFEAFTIGITKLGPIAEYDKDNQTFPNKEHTVGRHLDGKNGVRPGYQWTCVFGLIVVYKEVVYRLAIIAYTRQPVGDCLENDGTLGAFADGLKQWFDLRQELWDFDFSEVAEEARHVYHSSEEDRPEYEERGKVFPSFADPLGNYSAVLDAIDKLQEGRPCLPRKFWVELLIAILRHNSPSMLHHLILSWMPGRGASSRRFQEACDAGYGPHTLLLQECESRGISISNGRAPRCQWSMTGSDDWPDERKGAEVTRQVEQDVRTMTKILEDAEDPRFPHRKICDRVQQIKHIGAVKALGFYTVTVPVGFLKSPHAIRESHDAILTEANPGAQELLRHDFKNLDMALRRLSWRFQKTHKVMEHSLCKKYRHPNFCWDFVANEQRMYCCRRELNDMNQELTRFYRRTLTGTWQQYRPRLQGF